MNLLTDGLIIRLLSRLPFGMALARLARALSERVVQPVREPDFFAVCNLPRVKLVLDIGANRGQSAVAFLRLCPGATVVSLEPNPSCGPMLRLLAATYFGRLRYLPYGAGNEHLELPFYVPIRTGRELLEEGTFDRSQLETKETTKRVGASTGTRSIICNIIPIDELNLDPDFVKIDVQGFEYKVLHGMSKTIERASPVIMIESGISDVECQTFLEDRGYQAFFWEQGWTKRRPVGSVNTFFLRESDI
jgi:FkbM family methyltransferase